MGIDTTITIDKSKNHFILNALEAVLQYHMSGSYGKAPKEYNLRLLKAKCPKCGGWIESHASKKFCPYCGQSILWKCNTP